MSKILIVEDEEAIADLERDYLELSGFTVEVANDGDIGLQKALNEDYDLLILDLMLCRERTDSISAGRSVRRRIRRSLWFRPRRMISIRSGDWVLVRMII